MNTCPNCGTEFSGKFCPECGTPVSTEKTCPACGATMPASAKFCNECGHKFAATPDATMPAATPATQTPAPKPAAKPAAQKPATKPNATPAKQILTIYDALRWVPGAAILLFAVLLWAFFAAPVAKVVLGMGMPDESLGNVYQLNTGLLSEIPNVKGAVIALFVFAAVCAAYAALTAIAVLLWKYRTIAKTHIEVRTVVEIGTIVFYVLFVIVGAVICGKVAAIDGGEGIIKAGACPALLIAFGLIFAALGGGALVGQFLLAKKNAECAKTIADRRNAWLQAKAEARTRFYATHTAPAAPAANASKREKVVYAFAKRKYDKADDRPTPAAVIWVALHKGAVAALTCVLVIAIVLTSVLVPVLSNRFRIGVVKKIELGASPAAVKKLLGAPRESQSTDLVWKYYDKKYSKVLDELDKNAAAQQDALMNGDMDKFSSLASKEESLQQELAAMTYRYIEVDFEQVPPTDPEGESTFAVVRVLFDKNANDSAENTKKTPKTVSVEASDATCYTDADGKKRAIEASVTATSDQAGHYTATFTDGSFVRSRLPYHTTEKDDDGNVYVVWTDQFAEYKTTGGHSIGNVSKDGVWTTTDKNITSIVLPDSVTRIGDSAFENCTGLKSITIPKSVTSIGDYAFEDCTGLTSVTIPNSVTSIGSNAFAGCANITTVTMPTHAIDDIPKDSLETVVLTSGTSIGNYAFSGCTGLTSITLPESVTSIGNYAFYNCKGFTSITIPETVTSIGSSAFVGCTNITTATMPTDAIDDIPQDSLQTVVLTSGDSIGARAFYNCTGLESVTIPESVTSIGYDAFYGCTGLTAVHITDIAAWCNIDFGGSIANPLSSTCHLYKDGQELSGALEIPNSVTKIPDYAFYYCTKITSVTIPSSVTSIGVGAFYNCTGLTSVTIPESVTSIGKYVFRDCTCLTSVTIPDSVTSIGYDAFCGCEGLTSVTIPSSVTSIGMSAFSYCTGLTTVNWNATNCTKASSDFYPIFEDCTQLATVNIGANVEIIPAYAFYGCSKLTEITIPESVTSIGDYAFADSGLESIAIGNGVTSIGNDAFSGCTGLTSVTIPESVTSIGMSAFWRCNSLTAVHITDIAAWCNISFGGGNYYSNPLYYAKHLYKDGQELSGALEIPNGVTKIPAYAFYGCKKITSVTIPESVTSIGDYAFEDCTGLTAVHITDIAAWCNINFGNSSANPLYYAKHLYKDGQELNGVLVIPNGVTKIPNYAFYYCEKITSVTIPESVTSIGSRAFSNCTGLTSVTIPEFVEYIGDSAFSGCTSLTTVNWNATNCTKAGSYSGSSSDYTIFKWCTQLVTVNIGENVENIPAYAFYGCSRLNEITIPESVTSIGDGAFRDCTGLTSVTIPAAVTSIGSSAFSGCTGLESVTIPAAVTSIGNYAFYNCECLTSVTIGSGVTSIGRYAFSGCNGLTSAVFENPSGWKVSTNSSMSSASSVDVSNASTAAQYLRSTYDDYYWHRY